MTLYKTYIDSRTLGDREYMYDIDEQPQWSDYFRSGCGPFGCDIREEDRRRPIFESTIFLRRDF